MVMADEPEQKSGGGLIGVAITVAVSLVFLEVGESEDRARARGE